MAMPEDERPKKESNSDKVKDMYYYDILGLDPDVSSSGIKRRYLCVARKYSPDRAGAGSTEAQREFQEIGRAYAVLMNPELRSIYDQLGREGLWDKDEDDEDDEPVDPIML